jgi:acetolactate synthase-1/2/3 large subunit
MATGRPSAYAVVPGPGFLNTTAALSTAFACCAPVIALTGQVPQQQIGRGHGFLHEIPDQLGVMRSLTKWAARIQGPQEAPLLVEEAFRQLGTGQPQPVGLECSLDVWPRQAEVAEPKRVAPMPAPIDAEAIVEAIKSDEPRLIHVPFGPMPDPWKFVHPGKVRG